MKYQYTNILFCRHQHQTEFCNKYYHLFNIIHYIKLIIIFVNIVKEFTRVSYIYQLPRGFLTLCRDLGRRESPRIRYCQ